MRHSFVGNSHTLTTHAIVYYFLIVGIALGVCILLIWVIPPGYGVLARPPRDSKKKLTWLAVIGCAFALMYLIVTEYRLAH